MFSCLPRLRGAAAILTLSLAPLAASAVPLTPQEIAATCGNAEGLAHCGRLIEDIQVKRLPGLATREGDKLLVTLYPSGNASFQDTADGDRSYSLWDYLDPVNVAVIYVVHGNDASFLLLQRASGRTVEVPSEPRLSPDRQRIVTADFCADGCRNEVALWRVDRQGIRKEASWAPSESWSDATAQWKSPDTIAIEYTRAGDGSTGTIERRLGAPGWTRVAAP